MNNLVEERSESTIIIITVVVAEFCLQPFYNHIVVDGQHENTVINFKHVFQQFQYLNCIFRVDAIKIIDKKHESSSLTLSCQTVINSFGECISEFFRSGFIEFVITQSILESSGCFLAIKTKSVNSGFNSSGGNNCTRFLQK